jgi:hypothetical protein
MFHIATTKIPTRFQMFVEFTSHETRRAVRCGQTILQHQTISNVCLSLAETLVDPVLHGKFWTIVFNERARSSSTSIKLMRLHLLSFRVWTTHWTWPITSYNNSPSKIYMVGRFNKITRTEWPESKVHLSLRLRCIFYESFSHNAAFWITVSIYWGLYKWS